MINQSIELLKKFVGYRFTILDFSKDIKGSFLSPHGCSNSLDGFSIKWIELILLMDISFE